MENLELWAGTLILPRVPGPVETELNASTRYCAVYGWPVRHSASPAMHNAALAALGLNWRYLAFAVPPGDLRSALAGAAAMRLIGLNLTVPHKLLALEMMDELDASARAYGAVNTVRLDGQDAEGEWRPLGTLDQEAVADTRLTGFNTDADAVVQAIQEDLSLAVRGSSILILGAGGAGRVAALRFAAEGARRLFVFNRTESKAQELAADVQARFPEVEARPGYPERSVDLVVNATSLGLKPGDPVPLDLERFPLKRTGAVYDMVYRPAETPLLAAARKAGCPRANGLSMLLYQGAQALEIWSGQDAPVEIMRTALTRHIYV